eukprot:scaffold2875_cov120-Isochrysis_galbana.AAC.1
MRWADAEQGARVAEGEKAQAEPTEAADEACLARKLAKRDQPRSRLPPARAHALIVEQSDALLDRLVQQRHALGLALDRVREEHVRMVGQQGAQSGLLHPENSGGGREILGDDGARLSILGIREDSLGRWLDEDAHAIRGDPRDMRRRERRPPLPLGVRLAYYADARSHALDGRPAAPGRTRPGQMRAAEFLRICDPAGARDGG